MEKKKKLKRHVYWSVTMYCAWPVERTFETKAEALEFYKTAHEPQLLKPYNREPFYDTPISVEFRRRWEWLY